LKQFNLDNIIFNSDAKKSLVCLAEDFTISGAFYSQEFNYLSITVAKCLNSTKNNNSCESKENIEKFISLG